MYAYSVFRVLYSLLPLGGRYAKPEEKIHMIHPHAPRRKIKFAKRLRRRQTRAERLLWEMLRDQKLGARFWKQIVLLGWIVDFWCPKLKLVVEVDGPTHDGRESYDANRAQVMEERLGARTIRFTNREVITNSALVAYRLRRAIMEAA